MIAFNTTHDETVKRMRLVMFGTIIFDMLNTLAGQPDSFWHNAQTAIRGDGLSINNPTNHVFMLFLGSGWLVYLLASMIYLLLVFLLVTVLPRKAALVTIFAFIFGYYFDTANWLAVRWHLGMQGPFLYGLAVSAIVAFTVFPENKSGDRIKNLRWIMLLAILADAAATLIGQPHGYWHHPGMVDEGNMVSRLFLIQGWYVFLAEQAVIGFIAYRLATVLAKPWGVTTALYFTFAGFTGASNWFFYRWIWGMEAPVIFGAFLGAAIVLLTFPPGTKPELTTSAEQTTLPISDPDKKIFCVC